MEQSEAQLKRWRIQRIRAARKLDDERSREYWTAVKSGAGTENLAPASRFYLGQLVEEFRESGMSDGEVHDLFMDFYALKTAAERSHDQ